MVSNVAREMLRAHVAGELAGDLDATMAPLSDDPVWRIPGYSLEGREAVRAMYKMALKAQPAGYVKEILRALDDPEVTFWGETHCVIEYSDAYPLHRGQILVVHFDGDRVAGEHGYQTTPDQIEWFREGLGAALESVPGVTRVT
jgi:hypothetical protein